MSKASKCKFCNSTNCKTRIVCADGQFYDEVACDKHIRALETDADTILGSNNGIMRTHITSSQPVKRGEPFTQVHP